MEIGNYPQPEELIAQLKEAAEARRFGELRRLLEPIQPAGVALVLEEIDEKDLPVVYRLLPKETAADVFAYMAPELRHQLIQSFTDAELRETLDQ